MYPLSSNELNITNRYTKTDTRNPRNSYKMTQKYYITKKNTRCIKPEKKNNTTKEILSESLINMLNIFRESKIDTNSHVKRSDI